MSIQNQSQPLTDQGKKIVEEYDATQAKRHRRAVETGLRWTKLQSFEIEQELLGGKVTREAAPLIYAKVSAFFISCEPTYIQRILSQMQSNHAKVVKGQKGEQSDDLGN